MKVVWTANAFRRLDEIEALIERDDPIAAERHIAKLVSRGEALARFPNRGRRVPELPASGLRELIEGNYRIVYRVRGTAIEILTIFEGHHLLPLEELE